jgi:hypothetical protein
MGARSEIEHQFGTGEMHVGNFTKQRSADYSLGGVSRRECGRRGAAAGAIRWLSRAAGLGMELLRRKNGEPDKQRQHHQLRDQEWRL